MSRRYRYRTRKPTEQRFWRHVEPQGDCLVWTGASDRDGYGVFNLRIGPSGGGSPVWIYAHRYAWTLANGAIPDGLQVCHHCDNPQCVNAGHLFLGTNFDNVADRIRKMRGNTKLTETKVRAILADNRSGRAIAADYGVSPELIQRLRRGQVWARVVASVRAEVTA